MRANFGQEEKDEENFSSYCGGARWDRNLLADSQEKQFQGECVSSVLVFVVIAAVALTFLVGFAKYFFSWTGCEYWNQGGQNENEENEDGGDGMNAQQHEDCPPPEPQEQAQDEVSLDEDMVMEEVAEDEQLDKDPVVAMMPKKKIFVPLGIADLKSVSRPNA